MEPDGSYEVVRIDTWPEYRDWMQKHRTKEWMFRGQADARWRLWTSISRYLYAFEVPADKWATREQRTLMTFQRKAHLFLQHVPDSNDVFQWLALMQHHGAPTRLLDLTYSPYVAAFFALERAAPGHDSGSDGDRAAAVWCFDLKQLKYAAEFPDGTPLEGVSPKWIPGRGLEDTRAKFDNYFLGADKPFVWIGRPHVMNQRLTAQSATFAVPSLIDKPIDDVLGESEQWRTGLVKLELAVRTLRTEAMREMLDMNITFATLFPDLGGLARSMAYELEMTVASELYDQR